VKVSGGVVCCAGETVYRAGDVSKACMKSVFDGANYAGRGLVDAVRVTSKPTPGEQIDLSPEGAQTQVAEDGTPGAMPTEDEKKPSDMTLPSEGEGEPDGPLPALSGGASSPGGLGGGGSSRICKVQLSFEPQLATDGESINELFQVLFNTLLQHYKQMHEHGILGDLALAWLSESVGEAMDCANSEVNSRTAAHYAQAKAAEQGSSRRIVNGTTALFAHLRGDASKAQLISLFEPLMVEYLSLEVIIGTPSFWDRLPHGWGPIRNFGYTKTRAKVEALWAFVEAHEKVLEASPAIERFPELVKVTRRVVEEARADLVMLEQLRPRRYFFTKNLLALRVLLNNRLEKLRHVIDSGWISASDGEHLIEALQERITQADLFFPRIHTRADGNKDMRRVSQLRSNTANAWDDFDTNA